jgi:hypothetical protein
MATKFLKKPKSRGTRRKNDKIFNSEKKPFNLFLLKLRLEVEEVNGIYGDHCCVLVEGRVAVGWLTGGKQGVERNDDSCVLVSLWVVRREEGGGWSRVEVEGRGWRVWSWEEEGGGMTYYSWASWWGPSQRKLD